MSNKKRSILLFVLSFIFSFGVYGSSATNVFADQPNIDKLQSGYTYTFQEPQTTVKRFENIQVPIVRNASLKDSRYFGQQIQSDPIAWGVYKALRDNIEKLKTGTESISCTFTVDVSQVNDTKFSEGLQAGVDAFDRDYSEVFWLDVTKMTFHYIHSKVFGYTKGQLRLASPYSNYFISDYQNRTEVEKDIEQVNDVISKLTSDLNGSDYDKVKFFHDYLVNKNEYNEYVDSSLISQKAWKITSALYYGSESKDNIYNPVCEGYARAFKVLCDAVNIPNVLVSGDGDGEPHMWNYVKLHGKWYAVDATWNDPVYQYTPTEAERLEDQYVYFLKGSNNFPDHVNEGSFVWGGYVFSYPTLSLFDYDPMATPEDTEDDIQTVPTTPKVVKQPTIAKKINISHKKVKDLKIYGLQEDAKVTYTSNRKNVVYVYQNGKIKGMRKGTATITATVTQGGEKFTLKTSVICK